MDLLSNVTQAGLFLSPKRLKESPVKHLTHSELGPLPSSPSWTEKSSLPIPLLSQLCQPCAENRTPILLFLCSLCSAPSSPLNINTTSS